MNLIDKPWHGRPIGETSTKTLAPHEEDDRLKIVSGWLIVLLFVAILSKPKNEIRTETEKDKVVEIKEVTSPLLIFSWLIVMLALILANVITLIGWP